MVGIIYLVVVLAIQVALLIITYRVAVRTRRLADDIRVMVNQSSEDRELILGILTTLKGWTVSVDQNDKVRLDQVQQVANVAASAAIKSANEVKKVIQETIKTAVDATSARVSQMLDEKVVASKDSSSGSVDSGILGVIQVQRSPETH